MSIQLLCHFDGANGSTNIIDETGNITDFVCSDGAALSDTGQTFGNACLHINKGLVYSPSVIDFSTNDFTIRFRLTPKNGDAGSYYRIFLGISGIAIYTEYGVLKCGFSLYGGYSVITIGSLTDDVAYAFSLERYGSTISVYLDGVLIDSITSADSLDAGAIGLGAFSNTDSIYGKLDELLIDNGTSYAQGAASYTVETVPFSLLPVLDFELKNRRTALNSFNIVLSNTRLNSTEFELINRLAELTPFNSAFKNRLIDATDVDLKNTARFVFECNLNNKRSITIKKDVQLNNALINIAAFDVALQSYIGMNPVVKADFRLLNQRDTLHDSVVIDLHKPENPIYGSYE